MAYDNLLDHRRNKYSQAGQDGIIEHIFNVLGLKKGHFVEFGASDGIYLSNCRKLFEEGWVGVFIEADRKKFSELQKNYNFENHITCINKRVKIHGPHSFDKIMADYAPKMPVTFLSIDVDGIDLEIFESIEKYLPIVACLEGGKGAHPFDPRMPAYFIDNVGQSIKVINEVAKKKGYEILCAFQDTFLIQEEYFSYFKVNEDLFQLYLNGYRSQEYTHIPMYAQRLKILHRKNKILDYILAKTDYCTYKTAEDWAKENEQKIFDLLNCLPEYLYTAQMKSTERKSMVLGAYPKVVFLHFIREKRSSTNILWRCFFHLWRLFKKYIFSYNIYDFSPKK